MKDIGKTIKPMEEEGSFILMGMSMKESGKMTKLMVKVSILTLMGQDMKVNGWKTSNMDLVLKDGQTEHLMKDNMPKEKNMEEENLLGLIIALILVNSLIIIFTVEEYMNGQMEESTLVSGETIKWKDMAHLLGLTVENMWVNILMI